MTKEPENGDGNARIRTRLIGESDRGVSPGS